MRRHLPLTGIVLLAALLRLGDLVPHQSFRLGHGRPQWSHARRRRLDEVLAR